MACLAFICEKDVRLSKRKFHNAGIPMINQIKDCFFFFLYASAYMKKVSQLSNEPARVIRREAWI